MLKSDESRIRPQSKGRLETWLAIAYITPMSLSRDYRNVLVLAGCQAMFNSGRGLSFLASSLAAINMLDDDLSLVTLPIAMMLVGTALATLPAAHLMRRIGRKAGFVYGSMIGVGGGGLAMYALTESSFVLFNIVQIFEANINNFMYPCS